MLIAKFNEIILVRWNDAPIGHFLANYDSNLRYVIYFNGQTDGHMNLLIIYTVPTKLHKQHFSIPELKMDERKDQKMYE